MPKPMAPRPQKPIVGFVVVAILMENGILPRGDAATMGKNTTNRVLTVSSEYLYTYFRFSYLADTSYLWTSEHWNLYLNMWRSSSRRKANLMWKCRVDEKIYNEYFLPPSSLSSDEARNAVVVPNMKTRGTCVVRSVVICMLERCKT